VERSLRFALLLFGVLLALVIAACGGGGSASAPPPPPPPPLVSVSVSPSAVTVQPGATQQVSATVTGDPAAKGVTWTVSCTSIPCGSVSPTFTLSGTATTYTPPVTLPASNLAVTLTATSVADSTKFNSASLTIPQLPGFAGVSEAHVDSVNGMARLIINGKPAPPLLFMDQENFLDRIQYLAPQVQDAVARGIHLFQISLHTWPWDNQGTAPLDFSSIDQVMDNVIKADPQAILLLRIDGAPRQGWKPPVAPTAADYTVSPNFQFAPPGNISLASDIFFNGFLTSVPHLFQHLQNSSYGAHILGYNILGPPGCGEWFPCEVVHGPDYSPVNTQKFQTWLQNKYGTDAALSAAWGMPVTIATAQVPPPQPGRFPIQTLVVVTPPPPIYAFYQLPQEQDWVDYSAFTSDLYSQRILDIAKLFRTQTGGKRLIGFYNGYLLDVSTSFNGHLRFDRILASPDIDFLCAAITQFDRGAGGPGGADITIETVNAHGKLWISEEDLITYLSIENTLFPPIVGPGGATTADLTQTIDVLQRDLAAILIHRAGAWWFDINENGGFNDPAMWTVMSDYGVPLFNQLYANPQPYRPDVALIIDRTSIMFQKNDADMTNGQRFILRNELAKSGVSYGVYTLDDFLDGTEPPSKVYIFANTNYLTDAQISTIQSRLNAEGATAIWQYAPGFLGPNGADVTRVSKLTGIQVIQSDGVGWTDGDGLMAGFTWGYSHVNVLSPRLIVTDASAEVMGHYRSDNQVSSARKKVGNFESVFIGDFGMSRIDVGSVGWGPDALRAILRTTGVHIWSTAGDTISTDGTLLVVHAAAAGPDTISLPAGVTATPLGGGPSSTGTLTINFSRVGQTLWFRLS